MIILMPILCFFTICEYAILMEIGIGSSSSSGRQLSGRVVNEVPQMDFKGNPELIKIFAIYDLLAVRGHKLFAYPAIVDDPEEVLKTPNIIDELSFHERMINFAKDFREFIQEGKATETERELKSEEKKRFIKIRYPNAVLLLLLDVIKNVNVQNEIQNDLKEIWAEENVDELRLQQKYLFKFGFIVDCIFAYFMDDKQKIDFAKMNTATETKVGTVEQHPLYVILTKNKCASKDEIRIFVNLIIQQNEQITCIYSAQHFFLHYIKEPFLNEMANEMKRKGKLEEEYAQLRKDPYFPEKLPKIFNLLALLDVLPEIIVQIIAQIRPEDYKNPLINLISETLLRIKINILKGEKMFIASHYKRAARQIPKLRNKLGAIRKDATIFYYIFENDIKYQYLKWYSHLKFHIAKFLAEKYFDVSDIDDEDYWDTISAKIGKKIVQKIISHKKGNTQMEEERKNKLLAQMHLRIFCVKIRQMDSTKRIFSERYVSRKSIFHTFMDSELLEIEPKSMDKFNEIIIPKEELYKRMNQKDEHQKMILFFEVVSEVRKEICEEKQWQNGKN